jgi:Rod binding domain-containing protein
MSIFANGISNRTTAAGGSEKAKRSNEATGFSQIFTTMLVNKMREAMGSGKGPLGTGGGASGNVYGAFFDQAMGSARALQDNDAA